MTVIEITLEYLHQNNYDGLYHPDDECGCHIQDLVPCGENGMYCCPGYRTMQDDGDWIIGPDKPELRTHVSNREMNCMKCRRPGRCEVTFEYTEGGKVKSANVTRMEDGWKYLPYGDAGGEAPYCPECLKEMS